MAKDKNILIWNIYYMLSYAFQALDIDELKSMEGEEFKNINSLFTEILWRGISYQLRHGLVREYESKNDDISSVRGKINLNGTIMQTASGRQKINCDFDEFTENNLFNQILKTTSLVLLKADDVDKNRKKKLDLRLKYLNNVDCVDPHNIPWEKLTYQRNNKSYRILMTICYFVLSNMLLTERKGDFKAASFADNTQQMSHLYEKFILEYYRKHFPSLKASPKHIDWDFDAVPDPMFPQMITDVTLRENDFALVIDAKYYSSETQERFGKTTYHSNNLYQIYTYVNNLDSNHMGKVSGMLLYAKADEQPPIFCDTVVGGHRFSVRTLDLNQKFPVIKKHLNEIVSTWRNERDSSPKTEAKHTA